MEKKEVPAISVAIRHLVGAVMVGLFFWVLFVVLIFWAALIRALEWLADLSTENLARLTVRAGSLANTAWARSHLVSVIHATRQLWPNTGFSELEKSKEATDDRLDADN